MFLTQHYGDELTKKCRITVQRSGGTPDLREADLRGANLEDTDLRGADLRKADLRGANLQWAIFDKREVEDFNIEYANLRGSSLKIKE